MDILAPRKLAIFAKVYDLGSSTAAAEAMGVSQSAVSKSVAQLERDLDAPLFERSASGFHPTPAAEALRRRVRWIDRELEMARQEMLNATNLADIELKIGAGPVWSLRFLPQILPDFYRAFPGIRLDILTGSGDYFVKQFVEGKIDIYFGMLGPEFSHLRCQNLDLLTMKLQAYARADHPIFTLPKAGVSPLNDYPWIGFSHDASLDVVIAQWCERHGIGYPGLSMKMMSLGSMMAVANSTNHIVFAVDVLAEQLARNGLFVIPDTEDLATMKTGIALRQSLSETPPMRFLLRMLSKKFGVRTDFSTKTPV